MGFSTQTMNVDFGNIYDHVIPMDDFMLKWRFTEEKYDKLIEQHLDQLLPLDAEASLFLSEYISKIRLHDNIPFKKDFFRAIDQFFITEENEQQVKKWLYHRGLPFDKMVFLSYRPEIAMIVPWKLLIKYFDSFQYADDLTVIDKSLTWALLFFHEGDIYFGTNKDFVPETTEEIKFVY